MREAALAEWRAMGVRVLLLDGHSPARYDLLADVFHPVDTRDGSADVDRIAELVRGCDGVTTLSDASQATAARIAGRLGLPGVGPERAEVARSKWRQRELLSKAGITVPCWRRVTGPDDIGEFYAETTGRAVLKPVDSAGSAGVLAVGGEAEARRQWPVVRSLSPSRTAVIEEFLPGREVCVDAVIVSGRPVFVSVVDCEYGGGQGFIATSAKYASRSPDHDAAEARLAAIAAALKLADGLVHAEFKIDGDRWTPLEFALRPGGALVPELTRRVGGLDLYRAQALIALGSAAELPGAAETPACAPYAQVRFLVGTGLVRRFVPPATVVSGLPDVRLVSQFVGPGARVRTPVSEEGRAGCVAGWGDEPRALDEQLRVAVERLGVAMGLTVEAPPAPAEADVAAL
ncbi:ATP-grasp domain-containing protein [Amycolatopsis alba]|nr:ATP-grasp domain-containing protein [Amycolatopsis alba]